MPDSLHTLEEAITTDVRRALAEDVGTGDLTAALLPATLSRGMELAVLTAANLIATLVRFVLFRHWIFRGEHR